MRKTKEVLRLRFELGLGQRQIARSCGMGLGSVHDYLERRRRRGSVGHYRKTGANRNWNPSCLGTNRSSRNRCGSGRNWTGKPFTSNCNNIAWEEYRQGHPGGYRYSWFCERYQHWRRHLDVVLRQEHKAGEKMFVDWAGATIPVFDAMNGQAWPV